MANGANVLLCAMCVCNVLIAARGNFGNGHVNKSRAYDIIQSMLGFKEAPKSHQRFRAGDDAPRYMLDLYELLRSGNNAQQMRGDTARSVKAQIESVNGGSMFVFNLSVIVASQEDVISAQIHLYKRKVTNSKRRKDLEFLLHEISPRRAKESSKIVIPSEVYGWQWFDVTSVVKNCISNKRTSTHALGLSINGSNDRVNSNSVHLKRFIHRHSVPYLIIYSNDSQGIGINQITQLSTQEGPVGKFADESVENRSNVRSRRSLDENLSDSPLYSSRSRTYSILTNEIPEHPDDYDKHFPVIVKDIPTHPRMLQTRKESRHKINDPRIIPYPGDYVEKRKKKKKRKNRRKKQRGKQKNKLELPKAWDDLTEMAEEDYSIQTCGKRKLTIDFNDIGWGGWIISPESFKAHYCSGTCTFPLTKRTRPSNHATIQSLVNAVGVYPDVPAPCCVPESMSSITLLYFDETRNVVLKNYPNMTVQKCACR